MQNNAQKLSGRCARGCGAVAGFLPFVVMTVTNYDRKRWSDGQTDSRLIINLSCSALVSMSILFRALKMTLHALRMRKFQGLHFLLNDKMFPDKLLIKTYFVFVNNSSLKPFYCAVRSSKQQQNSLPCEIETNKLVTSLTHLRN